MCGIVTVIDFRAPVDARALERMRDVLAHRGPDDAGTWVATTGAPWAGMAHRRLSILDLSSAARQPMHSPEGRFVLVFNGEIYNYQELAAELESKGHRFVTTSDTEVLLAAYATWGEDCQSRLNGMWAFAVWDCKERRLFASRDRLGKKPLFYYWDGRTLALASEIKALVAHPQIPCRPRAAALEQFAHRRTLDGTAETMFERIHRLLPAHQLSLDAEGRFEIDRYWRIDPQRRAQLGSTEQYAQRFAELFQSAVQLRLRSDVAVGSSLSGGLDSSWIVGNVARLRQRGDAANAQRTFSARFPSDPTFDEGPFIDAVVAKTGVEAYRTVPRADALLADLRRIHYHQEEPFVSSSIFAQWQVMQLARRHYTTVLLDGQGADELLGGYTVYVGAYLMELLRRGAWKQAYREYRAFARRQAEAARHYPQFSMRTPLLTPQAALGHLWRRMRSGHGAARASAGSADASGIDRQGGLWKRLHADLTRDSLPALLRYADRNAMAFGVEVRNPFLDYRVVEFLMSVPAELKIHDGWTKHLLREAGRGVLPEMIRQRADKVGFVTPEDRWLRGPLRSWAEGVLFSRRLQGVPHYPLQKIRRAWEAHQSGRRNLRSQLWPWLSLHEWLAMIEAGDFTAAASTDSDTQAA